MGIGQNDATLQSCRQRLMGSVLWTDSQELRRHENWTVFPLPLLVCWPLNGYELTELCTRETKEYLKSFVQSPSYTAPCSHFFSGCFTQVWEPIIRWEMSRGSSVAEMVLSKIFYIIKDTVRLSRMICYIIHFAQHVMDMETKKLTSLYIYAGHTLYTKQWKVSAELSWEDRLCHWGYGD